jgi:hypothetical protein
VVVDCAVNCVLDVRWGVAGQGGGWCLLRRCLCCLVVGGGVWGFVVVFSGWAVRSRMVAEMAGSSSRSVIPLMTMFREVGCWCGCVGVVGGGGGCRWVKTIRWEKPVGSLCKM